jgi:hypothetical protein
MEVFFFSYRQQQSYTLAFHVCIALKVFIALVKATKCLLDLLVENTEEEIRKVSECPQ